MELDKSFCLVIRYVDFVLVDSSPSSSKIEDRKVVRHESFNGEHESNAQHADPTVLTVGVSKIFRTASEVLLNT